MSYRGATPQMLGYVLPILLEARRPVAAILQDGGQRISHAVISILTEARPGKGRGEGGAQNGAEDDRQCQGLLPPFLGGAILHPPFFFFGSGGIALKLPQMVLLLLGNQL